MKNSSKKNKNRKLPKNRGTPAKRGIFHRACKLVKVTIIGIQRGRTRSINSQLFCMGLQTAMVRDADTTFLMMELDNLILEESKNLPRLKGQSCR